MPVPKQLPQIPILRIRCPDSRKATLQKQPQQESAVLAVYSGPGTQRCYEIICVHLSRSLPEVCLAPLRLSGWDYEDATAPFLSVGEGEKSDRNYP
jgi:hypothetical protein